MGCIALVGPTTYTDFILEVTAAHDDDDGWGFVFGYDQITSQHYQASVINDEWPQPASDGVQGPFVKMKKTNGAPCVAGQMNETAGNHCYDTISYTDGTGAYVDGSLVTDYPGEYARKYPWKIDDVWPTRKLTLIVKDGEARVMVQGPEKIMNTPTNFYRQPDQYVATWTYNLNALGYGGGRLGLFTFAHQATFYNLTITDLSNDANLPTAYCNGMGTCTAGGVCTAVPVSDVCESPVGATVIDTTTLSAFEFIEDEGGMTQPCIWSIADIGRGGFLYQSSNAYGAGGSLDNALLGCNAMVNGPEYTDFIAQFDADNYDNDAPGIVFGSGNSAEIKFKILSSAT